MATISSIGVGSGLDVQGIISKMVDLEKQPLAGLQAKQAGIQAQVSTYAQIKSLTSKLSDAVSKLTLDSGWNALAAKSSSDAVSMTVSGLAQAASYDIGVSQLARAQTSVSDAFTPGAKLTAAGTLQLTPQGGTAISIAYTGDDTLESLAGKINDAVGSVTATIMRDATGERLMLRSKTTGADAAFTVTGDLNFTASQTAQNARITVNGVATESSTNSFDSVLPGLKIAVSQVTTTDAHVSVAADTAATRKNIQAFVDAYNELNGLLADSTKYDADTKTAGLLQGDSATVGLQNALRMLTMGTAGNASGSLKRLADVGIQMQAGGKLTVDDTKLSKALQESPDDLKSLFAAKASSDGSGGGIAVNFKQYTSQLLAFDGTLNSKSDSLASRIKSNQSDQDKVNERASVLQARLTRQYSALDTQMAALQSLSTYMQQQVANWNKKT
ncbi:MAG: hypothetical protein ABS45_13150 [Comamonas sp. SCN 65-56]|uniref:flagellar filament capping protein FliD n=1 Tax=Comamonas sp. SCN 65-56 TaxID=1660095 RepID=UPI00086C5DFE|nr:flagellar filament capping protein FliD [Comamonas sp. SCN 65-56]ODS90632.1 MAG: hypothetical protein ABS45_13150 [Comamonas sp. SCN 65-56]